jgi:hypothetical protein
MTEPHEPPADNAADRARRRTHDLEDQAAASGDDLAEAVDRTVAGSEPSDGEDAS